MTSLYSRITPHFTQDLLSPGLKIGYYDEGGVWQFVAPSLALRLPLRAIEWKNLVGVTKTIDRLPVNFIADPEREPVMPIVCIYVIKCEDLDRYKSTVRAQISQWIDRMNAAKVDWMLLYVPLGTRTKAGSGAGSSSSGSGGNRHVGHSAYKKIFDKIKNDFSNKKSASNSTAQSSSSSGGGGQPGHSPAVASDSARSPAGVAASAMSNFSSSFAGIGSAGASGGVSIDRICKIDTLEGASVVGTQSTHELQWTELLMRLRKCIMEAFECKCWQYEEEARLMDAKRSLPSWDFGAFFVAKERLALMYQQTYLLDDAIRHLDELEAIFSFLMQSDKRFARGGRAVTSADPMFATSPLAIDMSGIHRLIASNQAPPLLMRLYFFSRQIRTLHLMGDFRQLIQRSIAFISSFHEELIEQQRLERGSLLWYEPHLWAVGACFEIAYACELSWSGHDYQISTASIPDGVSFALTPEVMAGLLGDILYLARRTLKKSARSNGWWKMLPSPQPKAEGGVNSEQHETEDWFKSLAAMFQAQTPELFQRCVWEVSHLVSLHFSRTGRHRMAVFLGGECARYHLHHHEFESASRLFRSHARQCEEDKWWSLVSDCVKRICESELALGRSEQAVAACFSMLEIAQASKAEVSRSYLDQLLSSLVQSLDQNAQQAGTSSSTAVPSTLAVKMGELIQPSIAIETMQSPESDLDYGDVRVTLSLTNQFPAGIHIESVRVRFTKCEGESNNDGDGETAEFVSVDLDYPVASPLADDGVAQADDTTSSLVELSESNVYLYERASVNLIFLYGDVDVGVYTCAGLECSVAGNTFPLFSQAGLAAIRFEIPRRQSTLRLEINGPPLLIPTSMEEIIITIDTDEDTVHRGILEIAVPDGCDIVSLSHTQLSSKSEAPSQDDLEPAGSKCVVPIDDLPPKTRVTCSVWVIVSDHAADGHSSAVAPIAASLRYDPGLRDGTQRTELRRCEHAFKVLRPLAHTSTLKRIADKLFMALSLQCNDEIGVHIRSYALLGNGQEEATGWRMIQDLNDHVLGLRLRPSEAVHLVFGLQLDPTVPLADSALLRVGIEYDANPCAATNHESDRRWRADCLAEVSLADVRGAAYRIDVQPRQAPRQSTVFSSGEHIAFTVSIEERRVQDPSSLQIHPTLLLCLDEASDSEWILLGKEREALEFQTKQPGVNAIQTVKRLMPLRVGRLRFPRFQLRVEPTQSSLTGDAILASRVFAPQHAQSLLVV